MASRRALLFLILAALASACLAHEGAKDRQQWSRAAEHKAFGVEGNPRKAARTVKVAMNDKMRFIPGALQVRAGETVRFVVRNSGKLPHEFVLGTMDELHKHAELMRKHPDMEHDEPYMIHVAPGKTQGMVWQFTKAGEFYYGCLIPGHFEAGMVGRISVVPGAAK